MNHSVKKYFRIAIHRYDDEHLMKYFSPSDFPGLKAEPVSFTANSGEKMNGFYYSYENPKPGKLVVFCHGIGPGQKQYTTEIAKIAKAGYRVLAVDWVGCELSAGETIRAMSESLADLDAILNQLHTDDEIMVIGHSWGGYAASNIRNYHPEIKKVVVLSGFITVETILAQSLHGLATPIRKRLMKYEREVNPKYADSTALTAFEDDGADVLWFHSKDDYMVSFEKSFEVARKTIKSTRVKFIECDRKKHNPNYTEDAANYLVDRFTNFKKNYAKKPIEEQKAYMDTIDFKRMSAQDDEVWAMIFELFER